jgi:hypothetical protein
MSNRRKVVSSVMLAAIAATAAPAAASSIGIGPVTSFNARYGTGRTGASSGLHVKVTARPPKTGVNEAPAIQEVITLAPGTRIDTRGAVRCHASVAQLVANGAEAVCPAASRIGDGKAAGVVGGTTVSYDLGIYAFPGKLSFAAERYGVPLRQGFFGVISGRRITLDTPTATGAIKPTLFAATIAAHNRSGHALIETPRQCPTGGTWTISSTFQALTAVAGGHPVGRRETVMAHSPCR